MSTPKTPAPTKAPHVRGINIRFAEQGFIASINYDPTDGRSGMHWEPDKEYALSNRDEVVSWLLKAIPAAKKADPPKRKVGSVKM